MPGLILHTSNQLDLLAQQLSKVLAKPLPSPFLKETVVIQSAALRRWLSFQIADNHGICANYEFPFLSDFVTNLVTKVCADEAAERLPFEALIWKIDSVLRQSLDKREFAPIARYLRDGDSLKRFHLAIRLANLFDQYGAYRPEKLSAWAGSKEKHAGDEAWQASLWRKIGQTPIFGQTLQRLRTHGFPDAPGLDLPERILIFAAASIPPAYLDILFQLARDREVHFFVLRPSREYRGSDRTPKQRVRLGLTATDASAGNPLATSWGKVDADLTDLLLEKEEQLETPIITGNEQFREFETGTVLGTIQADILASVNRGAAQAVGSDIQERVAVIQSDRSLTVNSCYSPMREVEALYDQLLDCFATMPGLRPRDILVMTPVIEEYAPFIQAVFRYPEDERMRIPYSLADRHPRSESLTIDTFLTLLQLPGSRYTASQVFGLLGSRSIRRRFHFSDEDLSLIRDWIDQTNIRWGIDAEHRKRLNLPGVDANTWRHGLDRLLLGYAMEGKNRSLFDGILPHDEVEGDGADVLGRFANAAEALFQLNAKLENPRPLAEWAEPLTNLVDQFFDPIGEEDVRDVRFVRMIIDQLRTLRDEGDAGEAVEYSVLRHYLEGEVSKLEQHGNFFSAGVTFCGLKAVRGVPARVLCLLGINDQTFPRRPEPAQFDLMAQDPRTGDPSARHDDRYSFLQAVLAAKEKLIISYIGRSTIHNQQIPPSVVVSELIDYANQAFIFPNQKSAKEFLLTEHPLQSFSRRYFAEPREDTRLFGYSEANAAASRTIGSATAVQVPPFISMPLPQTGDPVRNVELGELIRFWKQPAEYFMRQRLGLNLRDRGFCLDDIEPFNPTQLDLYPLRQELLSQALDSETLAEEIFEERGILPPGVIGRLQLGALRAEMDNMGSKVRERIRDGKRHSPIAIDLAFPNYSVTGTIDNIYGDLAIHFRPAKLSPKDFLRAWVEHLALSVQNESGQQMRTILIGRDGIASFSRISTARHEMQTLCDLYLEGLLQPIRFYPLSSMAFAEASHEKRDPFREAKNQWDPWGRKGEKEDPYFRTCFAGADPFADPFAEIANKVFKTMLEQMERE